MQRKGSQMSTVADDSAAFSLGESIEVLAEAILHGNAAILQAERGFCTRDNILGVPLATGECIQCEILKR
jgi:hypothetical protein